MKIAHLKLSYILFLTGCCFSIPVISQSPKTINLQDANNRHLEISSSGKHIDGSYFADDEYQSATLITTNGTEMPDMKVKLDLKNNKVYFLNNQGQEIESGTPIKRILFTDRQTVYENGFPPVNKQDELSYYRVLVSGKASLLLFTKFSESQYQEPRSSFVKTEIVKTTEFFGASANTITRLSKPEDIVRVTIDKTQEITDYIKKEKIKIKNTDDLAKVFTYYNSLVK